ncbi:hypothetical protein PFISCL1PPCAC_16556, partial [Pristionchus fissidentatus]
GTAPSVSNNIFSILSFLRACTNVISSCMAVVSGPVRTSAMMMAVPKRFIFCSSKSVMNMRCGVGLDLTRPGPSIVIPTLSGL